MSLRPYTKMQNKKAKLEGGGTQQRIINNTSLLFPVRDGKFHTFHKSVVDWLTAGKGKDGGDAKKAKSNQFTVRRCRLTSG